MGSKKTEQKNWQETRTDMAPRSAGEQEMLNLLQQMASRSGGQIDFQALGDLASGQGLSPTEQDRQMVAENFGLTEDIAKRALEDFVRERNLGLDETLSSRGIQGSSIESVQRGLVDRDATRQLLSMLDRSRQEGNQQLMQLPFQRAGMQLGANQQLFNQLLQGGTTAAQFGLNERIADMDTSGWGTQRTETPYSFIDYSNAGANLVSAIRGGGAKGGGPT